MNLLRHREIWWLILTLLIAVIIGSALGRPLLIMNLVLVFYIVVHLQNLRNLYNWATGERGRSIPEATGIWGDLFNELFLREKQSGGDKSRLTGLLSQFEGAATAIPDGMVSLSEGGRIQWSNPAACELLGVTFPDDFGQAVTNIIRDPEFVTYLGGGDYSSSVTLTSPENVERVLELQVVPFGAHNKLLLARDVTHVTKLEQMRTNFVANVSHEMRTPITVICGYLETLCSMPDIDRPTLERALTTMYNQSRRMDSLVRDLLTLSRMETEPATRDRQIVDVPALLTSVRESAQLLSGDRKHNLLLDMDQALQLKGKSEELLSLFSNLINNAVRYTPAGGDIIIRWGANNLGQAVFSVQDNGPGIPAEHIPRLTERFYRVDADRSRETGGTGLGLAIVKHVADRHHAELSIASEIGKGSTFKVIFPRAIVLRRGREMAS